MHPLDNPVWHALTTRHRHLADGTGGVRRYRDGVSIFWAVEHPDADVRADVEALAGPGASAVIIGPKGDHTPRDWTVTWQLDGYQMVLDELVDGAVPGDVRRLGEDDVPAMLELVELTRPGPFLPRTIEMGAYHGVVRDGRLLAMAGQRFHLDGPDGAGFHEVSAVATHPDARGQGLAAGLSTLVARDVVARGEVPFLHVVGTNVDAIRVYERLGFQVRTPFLFTAYQLP